MNKEEIIKACIDNRGPSRLHQVVMDVKERLMKGDIIQIDEDDTVLPVEHYREIYQRRIERAKSMELCLAGMHDTTVIFESLVNGTELRSVVVVVDGTPIYFWFDHSSILVGCIIGKQT